MKVCKFEGCNRAHESRGYCAGHAAQLRRTGQVRAIRPWRYSESDVCSFADCGRRPIGNWLCYSHYEMDRKGEPLRPIQAVRGRGETSVRNDAGEKQCNTCLDWLPEAEFYASPQTKDRLGVRCKSCMKWDNTLRLFNVTPERYAELLAAQGGVCSICGAEPSPERRLAIDHDHACCAVAGRSCGSCVRGLLCTNCNTGIGMLNDSPERVASALAYLLSFEGVLV